MTGPGARDAINSCVRSTYLLLRKVSINNISTRSLFSRLRLAQFFRPRLHPVAHSQCQHHSSSPFLPPTPYSVPGPPFQPRLLSTREPFLPSLLLQEAPTFSLSRPLLASCVCWPDSPSPPKLSSCFLQGYAPQQHGTSTRVLFSSPYPIDRCTVHILPCATSTPYLCLH